MAKCEECKNYAYTYRVQQGFCREQPTGATTYKKVTNHTDSKMGCGNKHFVQLEQSGIEVDEWTGQTSPSEQERERYWG